MPDDAAEHAANSGWRNAGGPPPEPDAATRRLDGNPRDTSASDRSLGDPLSGIFGLDSADSDRDPLRGTEIGGVRLIRVIGQGGMGKVYEGEQQKLRWTVAVKVMRPGLATPEMRRRFEYEAEILARLRHPGIAQIFSAGVESLLGVPVPYFVMEYIPEARTLTHYAEDLKLPTRARLDLFRSVCEAVAHGHQKGVVHRDLKPANILVDATGQPKVIDFGVAKATDSDLGQTTSHTRMGQLVGTPQHMAPEQFDGDPTEIDTRCDVYALGVVLYELLTGQLPYDVRRKAVPEVMRIVKEEEPTPLSTLDRALRGDVAVIAGKCLEKDRAHRYSSASELGADIARHLAGEPIQASPPSFIAGLVRLARRHRAAAWALAGVFLALVLAVVGISVSWAQVALERKTAQQRLYMMNLLRLRDVLDSPRVGLKELWFQETMAAFHDAYGPQANLIELNVLQPMFDQSVKVFSGHTGEVTATAFSPGGSLLATASTDASVRLWDARAGTGSLVRRFEGHAGAVTAVAFSPDGTRLVSASRDGTARLWNPASGETLNILRGHGADVVAIAVSPDATRVATASQDKTARLWDTASGLQLAVLAGHAAGVTSIAFSPDGTRLATGSVDETVRLWDVATGQSVAELGGHDAAVTSIAFSRDGSRLATASSGGGTYLWDAVAGTRLDQFTPERSLEVLGPANGLHPSAYLFVNAIVFNPRGTQLAIALADGTAYLWDVTDRDSIDPEPLEGHDDAEHDVEFSPDGTPLATKPTLLEGHGDAVHDVEFSPDGTLLATASKDGTARMWNATDGRQISVCPGHAAAVLDICFAPGGTRVATASADSTARLWHVGADLAVLKTRGDFAHSTSFSRDGSRLAAVDGDAVRIWDVASVEAVADVPGACFLAFNHDGRRIAVHDGKVARVFEAATGDEVATCELPAFHGLDSLALSPDGTQLAIGAELVARIWDLGKRGPAREWRGRGTEEEAKGRVTVAFSPDGRRLATAFPCPDVLQTGGFGKSGAGSTPSQKDEGIATVNVWAPASGKLVAGLRGPATPVVAIRFSPDGRRLACITRDRTARVWDIATEKQLTVLERIRWNDDLSPDQVFAFSPDGSRLATISDSVVRLHEVDGGDEAMILVGHTGFLNAVAFSPDGMRLATSADDGTARLWDATTGHELLVLHGHADAVFEITFSPDGRRLATTSRDGTIRIWGMSNAEIYRQRREAAEAKQVPSPWGLHD